MSCRQEDHALTHADESENHALTHADESEDEALTHADERGPCINTCRRERTMDWHMQTSDIILCQHFPLVFWVCCEAAFCVAITTLPISTISVQSPSHLTPPESHQGPGSPRLLLGEKAIHSTTLYSILFYTIICSPE